MPVDLTGKVAIVTGSSAGIGQSIAVLFAKLGSSVVITGRNEANLQATKEQCLEHTSDTNILVVVGDITKEEFPKRLRDEAVAKFAKIDILVNNAGMGSLKDGPMAPIEVFDDLMKLNLRSVILMTQACMPDLIASKGTIVMNSSILSKVAWSTGPYYCMTKAALDHYTRLLAVEYGPKGIRVNSVNPGVIKTAVFESMGMTPEHVDSFLKRMGDDYPLKRVGEPLDVARAVAFLASDEASFISGTNIQIDGAFSCTSIRHDLLFKVADQSAQKPETNN